MDNLIQQSNELKKRAGQLLEQTGIVEDLRQFGEVHIGGAYAGNVMFDPDVDITVIRDEAYSADETLDILKNLYLKGAFRSYFIKGDWDDRRKGKEFPHGHYIGLKQRINGEKWVVDIWFVSTGEFEERKNQFLDIGEKEISEEEREAIINMKKERNERGLEVSSQQIYEAVLDDGARDIEEIKQLLEK